MHQQGFGQNGMELGVVQPRTVLGRGCGFEDVEDSAGLDRSEV